METVAGIFYLIVAVVAANIVHMIIPRLPLAIYQIAAGIILSLLPLQATMFRLHPELFMMLVIAPLLYNDGQRQSARQLTRHINTILSMALVLAIVSVIILGLGLHGLIPQPFTLPLAFMLAAIITPTDAVAVKSLTTNVNMPENVNTALEYESLFNDASGIVLFNLALASLTDGGFSIGSGIGTFLYVFAGGIAFGLVMGFIIIKLRLWLMSQYADITSIVVPIDLMTPLVVYFLAEEIHLSGILAVVAAGIVHSILYNRLQLTSTEMQVVGAASWNIIRDILNGLVFVFLGATLPQVLHGITSTVLLEAFEIGVGLYLVMTLIRFLWARFGLVKLNFADYQQSPNKGAFLLAIGGIHGTIAMAMAFSIPVAIHDHVTTFRNLLIIITTMVILISLVVGAITLPRVLPAKRRGYSDDEFQAHLVEAVQSAITHLQMKYGDHKNQETGIVINQLTSQMTEMTAINQEVYETILEGTQQVEMATVDQLNSVGQISDATADFYQQHVTRLLSFNGHHLFRNLFTIWKRRIKRRRFKRRMKVQKAKLPATKPLTFARILKEVNLTVEQYLSEVQTPDNVNEVAAVRRGYFNRQRFFNQHQTIDDEVVMSLFVEAFQAEHSYVRSQLNDGQINQTLANALNMRVSTDEMVHAQSLD